MTMAHPWAGAFALARKRGENIVFPPRSDRARGRARCRRITRPAAPAGAEGDLIRLGHRIVTDSLNATPQLARNGLKCSNCHLNEAREPWAVPLWGAWAGRAKDGSFSEAEDACYTAAMGAKLGSAPDANEMAAISAYARFLATGLPDGVSPEDDSGHRTGHLRHPKADEKRGAVVFARACVECHGAGNETAPPLWGANSYSSASAMTMICCSSAVIKSFMPRGKAHLSDEDALDVAAYINAQPRLAKGEDIADRQGIVSTLRQYAKQFKKLVKRQLYELRDGLTRLWHLVSELFAPATSA